MKRFMVALAVLVACHGNDSSPTAPPLNTAALTGKVMNAVTSVPLERVEIAVVQSGQTMTTLTASTGNYSFFTGLVPGSIQITAKANGYTTFNANVTVTTGSNRYDIRLQPAP